MKRKILFIYLLFFILSVPLFSQDEKKSLVFSGYRWTVKTTDRPIGPGPNLFSSGSIQSKASGIELTIRQLKGEWHSSEIYTGDAFSYGVYSLKFRIPEPLDSNAVFGFFLYNPEIPPNYNEIDFEAARWGDPGNPSYHFTIQPYMTRGNSLSFFSPGSGIYTCRILWSADAVTFYLLDENERVLLQWVYRGQHIPVNSESNVHLNLWLFQGQPPAGDGGLKVDVLSFYFESDI